MTEHTHAAGRPVDSASPPVDDFPYYNGVPVRLTGAQWWTVIAACVVAFALLLLPIEWGPVGELVPAIGFAAIPLGALYYVARNHWTAIFRRLRPRDFGLMVGFAALNVVVTFIAGFIAHLLTGTNANPAVGTLEDASGGERVLFLLKTIPQLFGEELVTILPLLAIMYLCCSRFDFSRKRSIVIAWIATAVVFGLLHLPTYDWNVIQCLLVIGVARLVLTLAYFKTKNILVSTGAHILNDWTLFGLAILGAGAAAA